MPSSRIAEAYPHLPHIKSHVSQTYMSGPHFYHAQVNSQGFDLYPGIHSQFELSFPFTCSIHFSSL